MFDFSHRLIPGSCDKTHSNVARATCGPRTPGFRPLTYHMLSEQTRLAVEEILKFSTSRSQSKLSPMLKQALREQLYYISMHFYRWHYKSVNGQLHAPAALSPVCLIIL
jgi:hypothetical protein